MDSCKENAKYISALAFSSGAGVAFEFSSVQFWSFAHQRFGGGQEQLPRGDVDRRDTNFHELA